GEPGETGHGQALRAPEVQAGVALAVAPTGPCARVEQHAQDHHVREPARALLRRMLGDAGLEGGEPLDATHIEMAEATVGRDLQGRVALARDLRRQARGLGERREVDLEVLERPLESGREDALATLANGARRTQVRVTHRGPVP